jgi:hypothetical protein
LHSFRHAFVSQAFLDGASEGEIREWVGHTNSRIVERYRHLRNEDAQRKMRQIDFFGDGDAGRSASNGDSQPAAHQRTQSPRPARGIVKTIQQEESETAEPDVPICDDA